MQFVLFITAALAPGLIWLAYFLRKDLHPEPKEKILKIFLWGMFAALPAIGIEQGLSYFFSWSIQSRLIASLLTIFIAIALTEEALKFLVVKKKISHDKDFDEPVDAIIYMITAAMGFATFENFLILAAYFLEPLSVGEIDIVLGLQISALRFVGATFLHALASGLMGFFFAHALCRDKQKYVTIAAGLAIVTLLHGLFNVGIMQMEGASGGILAAGVILFLAAIMPWYFRKVKKLHADCKF